MSENSDNGRRPHLQVGQFTPPLSPYVFCDLGPIPPVRFGPDSGPTVEVYEKLRFGPSDTVHLAPGTSWKNCIFYGCEMVSPAGQDLQGVEIIGCEFYGRAAEWFYAQITTSTVVASFSAPEAQDLNEGASS